MSDLVKMPNRPMILIGGWKGLNTFTAPSSVYPRSALPLHFIYAPSKLYQSARMYSSSSLKKKLTHVDASGSLTMVDVGSKSESNREATAVGQITMSPETFQLLKGNQIKKGDVLTVAKVAGIQGAKQTSQLIPLCHPLLLTKIYMSFTLDEASSVVQITSTVFCSGKTGVEMEALTATAVAALTIYDMCKAADKTMVISGIRVIDKKGGKSGHFKNH